MWADSISRLISNGDRRTGLLVCKRGIQTGVAAPVFVGQVCRKRTVSDKPPSNSSPNQDKTPPPPLFELAAAALLLTLLEELLPDEPATASTA